MVPAIMAQAHQGDEAAVAGGPLVPFQGDLRPGAIDLAFEGALRPGAIDLTAPRG